MIRYFYIKKLKKLLIFNYNKEDKLIYRAIFFCNNNINVKL